MGKALKSTGNGSCLFNAVATAAWGRGRLRPSHTDNLALPLRLAVVLCGVSQLRELARASSFFRRMNAYDGKVTDKAKQLDMDLVWAPDSDTLPEDTSRALLVLSLSSISGLSADGSHFCLPLIAEVVGVNVRCFHPGMSTISRDAWCQVRDVFSVGCKPQAYRDSHVGPISIGLAADETTLGRIQGKVSRASLITKKIYKSVLPVSGPMEKHGNSDPLAA